MVVSDQPTRVRVLVPARDAYDILMGTGDIHRDLEILRDFCRVNPEMSESEQARLQTLRVGIERVRQHVEARLLSEPVTPMKRRRWWER